MIQALLVFYLLIILDYFVIQILPIIFLDNLEVERYFKFSLYLNAAISILLFFVTSFMTFFYSNMNMLWVVSIGWSLGTIAFYFDGKRNL